MAQERKFTYIQFDASASITGNPDRYAPQTYVGEKHSSFIPNGIGAKLGYGLRHKQWVTLGIHSGINWKWNEKLVSVPIYLNLD